jgi:hypothetical protein
MLANNLKIRERNACNDQVASEATTGEYPKSQAKN